MLIRIHPKMREKAREIVPKTEKIVDVSLYPDIQELMVVADALITDYSSAVFDFILTYKPGFIYAINEQRYDIERGLYYPLTATPFTVARNNEELERNIINFDAIIISLISFISVVFIINFVLNIFNKYLKLYLKIDNFLTLPKKIIFSYDIYLYLLLFCLFIALLFSFIPLKIYLSKKECDLMREE